MIERFKIPGLEGRRIIALASFTIEWVGTQLTYVSVVARGCATVHVVVFKHTDFKIKHLYSLNLIPDLQNPNEPELNAEQKYSRFPCDVKMSVEGAFMAVTLCNGEVKLFKMPAVLNPMESQPQPPPEVPPVDSTKTEKGGKGLKKESTIVSPVAQTSTMNTAAPANLEPEVVKADLDKWSL